MSYKQRFLLGSVIGLLIVLGASFQDSRPFSHPIRKIESESFPGDEYQFDSRANI